jgi:hypothetical protein
LEWQRGGCGSSTINCQLVVVLHGRSGNIYVFGFDKVLNINKLLRVSSGDEETVLLEIKESSRFVVLSVKNLCVNLQSKLTSLLVDVEHSRAAGLRNERRVGDMAKLFLVEELDTDIESLGL